MTWAIRNFGLLAFGMCILASAATIDMRLLSMENKLIAHQSAKVIIRAAAPDNRLAALACSPQIQHAIKVVKR